jgi:hypothetical protein
MTGHGDYLSSYKGDEQYEKDKGQSLPELTWRCNKDYDVVRVGRIRNKS